MTAIVTEIGDTKLSYAMRNGKELSGISLEYERLDLTTSSQPSFFVYAGHPIFTTSSESNRFTKIMDRLIATTDNMVVSFYHSFEKKFIEDTYRADNRITLDKLKVNLPQSELTLFSYCAGLIHYCFGLRIRLGQDEYGMDSESCSRLIKQMYTLNPTDFECALEELFDNQGGTLLYQMIKRAVPQTYAHTMVIEM